MAESDKQLEQEYCNQIKDFFQSSACQRFLLPMIQEIVAKELPKPNSRDWQGKYVYAFALSDAFTMFINTMNNLSGRDEFLKKVERLVEDEGGAINGAVDEA